MQLFQALLDNPQEDILYCKQHCKKHAIGWW